MKRLHTTSAPIRLSVLAATTALVAVGCGSEGVQVSVGDTIEPSVVSVDARTGTVDAGRTPLEPSAGGTIALPDGWFEMQGYGTVLQVAGDEITSHYVTASTCAVGDSFDNELPVDHANEDAGGVLVVDLVGSTTDYRLLPLVNALDCDSSTGQSMTALDEVFDAHYPFFAERGVDWQTSVDSIRAAVADDPSALEPALAEFMTELADGHTTFDWLSIDPAAEAFGMPDLETVDDIVAVMGDELDATLARVDGLRTDPTGTVGWGTLDDSIGYLLLAGFEGPAGDDDPVAARDALGAAMDAAITDLDTERLVVDVRFNQGGSEDLAVLAAGYFVDEDTPAYRKWAYAQPDPFVQVIEIEPRSALFVGEVVVLTSPITASAAEAFTLSMKAVADATIVGNRSFGEFSDAIDWVLPNGIEFTMSMEVYTDLDGRNHEAQGVPVDLETRFDEGLDAAVEHLS